MDLMRNELRARGVLAQKVPTLAFSVEVSFSCGSCFEFPVSHAFMEKVVFINFASLTCSFNLKVK